MFVGRAEFLCVARAPRPWVRPGRPWHLDANRGVQELSPVLMKAAASRPHSRATDSMGDKILAGATNECRLLRVERRRHLTTGARATQINPTMKNANIRASRRFAERSARANSFHTNTPQMAETMVAPCPSA